MRPPLYAALVAELGIDPAPPDGCLQYQATGPVFGPPWHPLTPGPHPGACRNCGRLGADHARYWNRVMADAFRRPIVLSDDVTITPYPATWDAYSSRKRTGA